MNFWKLGVFRTPKTPLATGLTDIFQPIAVETPQDIQFKCCFVSKHLQTSVYGLPVSIQHPVRTIIDSKIRFYNTVSLEFPVNFVTVQSAILLSFYSVYLRVTDCDVHGSLFTPASYGCHKPITVLCDLHHTSYLFQRLPVINTSFQFGSLLTHESLFLPTKSQTSSHSNLCCQLLVFSVLVGGGRAYVFLCFHFNFMQKFHFKYQF